MDLAIERLQTLQVADIMTRHVIPVPVSFTLKQTAAVFRKHEISAAPVVDDHGNCVGILSVTDLLRRLAELTEQAKSQPLVGDYMTTAVQSVAPEASILLAARMMCAQHVHRLVVLDHDSHPVGIISCMDIVAALVNAMDEMGMRR